MSEWLVGLAIGGLVLVTLASFSLYSARSFVTLRNCVDLDSEARVAVDRMSQEIRQARRVTEFNPEDPSRITLLVRNTNVTFAFNGGRRTLERLSAGQSRVLLKGCDRVTFAICTRQATNAVYDLFPTATTANAKVVQINWNCSREVLGQKANVASMQSAQVVIRKQGR